MFCYKKWHLGDKYCQLLNNSTSEKSFYQINNIINQIVTNTASLWHVSCLSYMAINNKKLKCERKGGEKDLYFVKINDILTKGGLLCYQKLE